MQGLEHKTVIITGGAQGIGRGIARRFLAEHAKVMIADMDAEALEECKLEYPALNTVRCDVSSAAQVELLIQESLDAFGRLDFLVNNAGMSINAPVEQLSLEDWNRVIGLNLTAAFLTAKYAAAALRETHGAIVNIASTRALQSEAHTEAYSASKGGLLALTHALAISLGPQVRVNAVSPGWIETRAEQKTSARRPVQHSQADESQHPVGRVGTVEDIAGLVTYLCSSEAGFITGQNFVVDGGMTKKMIYVP